MIRSIEIRNLRGIREGRLDGLSPLTILVGPNGCGKSTLLEALILVASPRGLDARQLVCERRPDMPENIRWLRWKGDLRSDLKVAVQRESSDVALAYLEVKREGGEFTGRFYLEPGSDTSKMSAEQIQEFVSRQGLKEEVVPDLRLIESAVGEPPTPLHCLYTRAVQRGQRAIVAELVGAAIPGASGVEILTAGEKPVLHVVLADHTVPAPLVGDGTYGLLRLVLELATCPGGLVLLEEPECHQHPGNIMVHPRIPGKAARILRFIREFRGRRLGF